MGDFQFVGRYSIQNVDFTVIDSMGAVANADAAPTVGLYNYATGALVVSRPSVQVTNPGVYRITLSSVETSNPGLWYLLWSYNFATVAQQYRTNIEIPSSTSKLYDTLSDGYRSIVDGVWMRFEDGFDSNVGGPHLQMYAQANFGHERVAQLMGIALKRINTASQPHTTYAMSAGTDFPFTEWGGILEQATAIEAIKHLMRSYVEQPAADGVNVARLDRRDYLSRWGEILEIEEKQFEDALAVFKLAQMNLGRGSVLVSGGLYGSLHPTNPTRRPRYLSGWVR